MLHVILNIFKPKHALLFDLKILIYSLEYYVINIMQNVLFNQRTNFSLSRKSRQCQVFLFLSSITLICIESSNFMIDMYLNSLRPVITLDHIFMHIQHMYAPIPS